MIEVPSGASELIMALAIAASVIVSWINSRNLKAEQVAQNQTITAVHDQVANTHSTNLRDDLDGIRDEIRGMRADHRQDMLDIRGHLREADIRLQVLERAQARVIPVVPN